ncbi:hypothetical protein MKK75_03835 [Methylobacterium sp. J-030]|uniref:hypothetical protein n=1 Tax=Methylobacterium sp. J-030 TaxID=2836627 RepID=UPI001FBB84E2|nr:hypothetical protein [Methylobacterium sp. J-030]MCJ2067946.1 hypothetical protein [Methylobacterium sp. J-030]
MIAAHQATGTAAPIGPTVAGVFALDRRLVPVVALSAFLTTTLPALADFDTHRYEDTARETRPPVAPREEPVTVKRIRTLAVYEAGWDGSDSIGPTVETVKQAIAFAHDLHSLGNIAQPYISLASDGEINFYWDTPQLTLDLGFTGTGRYSYYGRTPDGVEFVEDGAELGQPLPADLIAVLRS